MECPHLEKAVQIDFTLVEKLQRDLSLWTCSECKSLKSPWVCLKCGVVNCGRYINGHAKVHYESNSTHSVCLDQNLAVFCYACDEFVINDTKTGKIDKYRECLRSKNEKSPGKRRGFLDGSGHRAKKSFKFDDQENLKKGGGPHYLAGLRNLGNTCFMNAVLQSLRKLHKF